MGRGIKILIAEDEALIAMRMKVELEDMGHTVCRTVVTGEEAVRVVKDEQPHIVFIDIRLAGSLSGIETARSIREFSGVPVVFISGYSDEKLKEEALGFQPALYLSKPVRSYDIESAIKTLVGEG